MGKSKSTTASLFGRGDLLIQRVLHAPDKIRKLLQRGPLSQRFPEVVSRSPENGFSRLNISKGRCVSPKLGSAAYGQMVFDSRAPSHYDTVTQSDGSSQSGLTRHHAGATEFTVVGNLNQIVDFRSVTDKSGAELPPVHTTSGADLNAVSNSNRTDLGNFDQASTIG
jgi:hypothetical protein